MEVISAFDMLKVGIGPSSSHTLGPWRAAQRWLRRLERERVLDALERVEVHLYGSLALTGRGHCTDKAVSLALLGHDPETVPVEQVDELLAALGRERRLVLGAGRTVAFDPATDIHFHGGEQLPYHPNALRFVGATAAGSSTATYYSVGGGFVVGDGEDLHAPERPAPPYPCATAADVLRHCRAAGLRIAAMVEVNEATWAPREGVRAGVLRLWRAMLESVHRGCRARGTLPGGLDMPRRAAPLAAKLLGTEVPADVEGWIEAIRGRTFGFRDVMKWVSCFALAVNEENAALGRVVTAPTNGAAGVIPAVLLYHVCFADKAVEEAEIVEFLLVAAEVGALFKKGATISAAMGGCQAEIGVSSAMAAAALCEVRGGSAPQALAAAEIAMEHHLGMTCDPVAGLVQIPCIERNAMGAVKAINAAELALEGDPAHAKVSLDQVIRTMGEVARDMSQKYKETSQGGLATNISVRLPEC